MMNRLSRAFGSWEFGLILFMAVLYLVGTWINPNFFGSASALGSVLRDAARFGVMAVGMSFVIINRDLDLSVGSTLGLVSVVFAIAVAPTFYDLSPWIAAAIAIVFGLAIGLINGVLVTYLRVPAFIATLTMLFIGRGLVLGLTGGQNIGFAAKQGDPFFTLGITNGLGFNNQIIVFAIVAIIGGFVLARTRWGYETYAVGGNLLAAGYAGVNTARVRIRAFVISSLCATLAGLMNMAQDKGVHSQYGQGNELIVIAAVIIGGASILGGRGRIAGACLGAILIVLIDKVLREGVPITRVIDVAGTKMELQAMAQLPPGAVPAFLGLILMAAVLIEPWIIRRRIFARAFARLKGQPPPPALVDPVAIESVQTTGTRASGREIEGSRLARLFARREAAAMIFVAILWGIGFWLRPDFWGNLDNTFNLLLAFSEIGLMTVGMAYVMRNGDIDLSVGAVLALAGSTTAFLMKMEGAPPLIAGLCGFRCGHVGRLYQRLPGDEGAAAGVRRDIVHVLYRPRHRRLAGGGPPAQPIPGELQPARTQADRGVARLGLPAGARQLRRRTGRRAQHADADPVRARRDLCGDPLEVSVRLHGDGHRRQPARRRLCRHQHRSRAVREPVAGLDAGLARRPRLCRVLSLVQSFCRHAARARRHRRRGHRRRQHLRRLRLGPGGTGRRLGDHLDAGAAVAADLRERTLLRDAAALGQCLDRHHPDRRGARGHLAAAGAYTAAPVAAGRLPIPAKAVAT
jgi:ribose/xylose/arabinose/galactoside ABC-type transport system permease subunit